MTAAKRTSRDVGLRQLPSGSWEARYVGPDGVRYPGVFPTKREAAAWRRQSLADADRGAWVAPNDTTTVEQWARQWVEGRPLRASTAKRYRGMIAAHIVGTPLAKMRLTEVRTSHLQAWVTSRSVLLAPSSLARVVTFARSLFKAAMADRLITWNPADAVVLPAAEDVEHVLVTSEQVARIEAEVPERYRALVRVLSIAGLRIGEALALRVEDVDHDAQVIRVRRSLDQKAREVGPVKSKRSKRDVPVSGDLLAVLAAHQLAHPPVLVPGLGALLFTSAHGRALRYDVVAYKVFGPAATAAKAPGVTPHDLRHYAGSCLLHDGVPVTTAAKVLGHSVQVLMATYAHAMPSGDDLVRVSMRNRARVGTSVGTVGPRAV